MLLHPCRHPGNRHCSDRSSVYDNDGFSAPLQYNYITLHAPPNQEHCTCCLLLLLLPQKSLYLTTMQRSASLFEVRQQPHAWCGPQYVACTLHAPRQGDGTWPAGASRCTHKGMCMSMYLIE
jgi:hypothetical protein